MISFFVEIFKFQNVCRDFLLSKCFTQSWTEKTKKNNAKPLHVLGKFQLPPDQQISWGSQLQQRPQGETSYTSDAMLYLLVEPATWN